MTSDRNYWLKVAEYDLETAKAMLDSKRYLYVGYMCHQAIEKILKNIYVQKYHDVPPRIHNLARLIKLVNLENEIPNDLLQILNNLNPLNIATRYPDEELEIMKDFDYHYSSSLLEDTRRLFQWLKTRTWF